MNWEKYEQRKKDRYSRFVHTLAKCGMFLLNAPDETIAYNIFEEFDIDVRCNLCDENLQLFLDEYWIDETIQRDSVRLRELFCAIQREHPEIWDVQSVRNAPEWLEILQLSDSIKSMLFT